jgi:hypothetical protein
LPPLISQPVQEGTKVEETKVDWNAEAAKFKFAVGDVVVYLALLGDDRPHKPARMVVVDRSLTQCHGGVQRNYRVNLVAQDSYRNADVKFAANIASEVELAAFVKAE